MFNVFIGIKLQNISTTTSNFFIIASLLEKVKASGWTFIASSNINAAGGGRTNPDPRVKRLLVK